MCIYLDNSLLACAACAVERVLQQQSERLQQQAERLQQMERLGTWTSKTAQAVGQSVLRSAIIEPQFADMLGRIPVEGQQLAGRQQGVHSPHAWDASSSAQQAWNGRFM